MDLGLLEFKVSSLSSGDFSNDTLYIDASVVFVDRCSISSGQDNDWVAVIDASKPNTETCNYCDKMAAAIREGAAGVIFIHRPGSTQGMSLK